MSNINNRISVGYLNNNDPALYDLVLDFIKIMRKHLYDTIGYQAYKNLSNSVRIDIWQDGINIYYPYDFFNGKHDITDKYMSFEDVQDKVSEIQRYLKNKYDNRDKYVEFYM